MQKAVSPPRVKRGTTRMFESDPLERLSHVHPLVPAFLYLPVVIAALAVAIFVKNVGWGTVLWQTFAGYLLWTLFEYWLHRLMFHMPVVGPKTARIQFLIHGVHHDYPWDETRLVIPPAASLVLCVLTYLAFRAALGPDAMYAPFAGFVLGYVVYDETHWYVHAFKPTTRFGRWLRREHFLHHFKEPTTRFGVSCPWLDNVFGPRGTPLSPRANEGSAVDESSEVGENSAVPAEEPRA